MLASRAKDPAAPYLVHDRAILQSHQIRCVLSEYLVRNVARLDDHEPAQNAQTFKNIMHSEAGLVYLLTSTAVP